ncbi:MAG: (Na+)-NQR maturation NqrM [Methylococcus sp.]
MTLFLTTFVIITAVVAMMAIGVIFGRSAIKGSCGGVNNGGECICTQKCEKRRKLEAMAQGE